MQSPLWIHHIQFRTDDVGGTVCTVTHIILAISLSTIVLAQVRLNASRLSRCMNLFAEVYFMLLSFDVLVFRLQMARRLFSFHSVLWAEVVNPLEYGFGQTGLDSYVLIKSFLYYSRTEEKRRKTIWRVAGYPALYWAWQAFNGFPGMSRMGIWPDLLQLVSVSEPLICVHHFDLKVGAVGENVSR